MKKFVININGEFYDEETAKISVFDRGFLYGDSVYEATRTFNRKAFRISSHIGRLFESAQKIDLIPSIDKDQIINEINRTIAHSPHDNIALRIILTRGTNTDLGLDPSLSQANNLIIISKAIAENPKWWLEIGWKTILFQKTSTERGSLAKTGNYQENMLAFKEAKSKGADDALMFNSEGFLCEGTTSNVWIIKDEQVLTPALSLGLLDGLTRQSLFAMCQQRQIPCLEANITRDELMAADEVFITSTTRNLVPVTSIDGKIIGSGRPGAKTLELLKLYLEYVSKEN